MFFGNNHDVDVEILLDFFSLNFPEFLVIAMSIRHVLALLRGGARSCGAYLPAVVVFGESPSLLQLVLTDVVKAYLENTAALSPLPRPVVWHTRRPSHSTLAEPKLPDDIRSRLVFLDGRAGYDQFSNLKAAAEAHTSSLLVVDSTTPFVLHEDGTTVINGLLDALGSDRILLTSLLTNAHEEFDVKSFASNVAAQLLVGAPPSDVDESVLFTLTLLERLPSGKLSCVVCLSSS